MSSATTTGLPSTRSFRRVHPGRPWVVAVVIAIAANLLVVVVLSQVSHLHQPSIAPPLATITMNPVPPEEPPPPPPETPREETAETSDEPVSVPLPALDLAPAAPGDAFALPSVDTIAPLVDLPAVIPPYVADLPPGPPAAVAGPPGMDAVDTPARREEGLDVRRFYPRSAKLRGITGTTRAQVTVDATGRLTDVRVLESTPPGVFDDAAVRCLRASTFTPAQSGGVSVASMLTINLEWKID
jgi:periplasmic protein TonB